MSRKSGTERLPSLLRFIDGVLTRAYLSEQKPGNTTQIHTLLILAEVPEVLLLCFFFFFDEYLSSIRKKHLLLLLSFHILNVIQRGNLTIRSFLLSEIKHKVFAQQFLVLHWEKQAVKFCAFFYSLNIIKKKEYHCLVMLSILTFSLY